MTEQEPQLEHNLALQEDENIVVPEKPSYDPQPTINALKRKVEKDYFGLQESITQQLNNGTMTPEKASELERRLDDLSLKDLGYEISKGVSVERAKELLGNDMVFGLEAVKKAFDIELDENEVPKIPFSARELERAKEFGQFLVLRADKAQDGEPLTMAKIEQIVQPKFDQKGKGKVITSNDWPTEEEFFTAQTPKLQWALTTKEIILGSKREDYFSQTKRIANYIEQLFKDFTMPKDYADALEEFNNQENDIVLNMNDVPATNRNLSRLKINQLARQSPVEAMYDQLIYFQNNDKKILDESTWTNALTSTARLVSVGFTFSGGLDIYRNSSAQRPKPNIGVCFSRSF